MSFADQLAALNEWHFFREFTYSQTTFQPAPGQEVELADSLIWLGNALFAFQLKERMAEPGATADTEKRWFERKVLKQATKQMRDTVKYLQANNAIAVRNHRGHNFSLSFDSIRELHMLVVYLPDPALPADYLKVKFHRSRTAGLIHILPAHDYLGIVRTLLTPAEVTDYLNFRAELIDRWGDEVNEVPESALVGHYLGGDVEQPPAPAFAEQLARLHGTGEDWDMSGVIAMFPDRITTGAEPTDYYQVVRELALLRRGELREFKKRFTLSLEKARADELVLPYRMAIPRTGCGFVFVPVTKEFVTHRRVGLTNLTLAQKHDMKLAKCLGVSIADDENGWFTAEWCFVEFPWEENLEMDELLRTNSLFREVRITDLPRY